MSLVAWTNGKRRVTGRWTYHWASDRFVVELDQRDRITGQPKCIVIAGDSPEWGNWKLEREEPRP